MGNLLGFVRAAIQPTATAYTSFEQGKDQEEDKQRALAHQTLLDQMKQSLNDAQVGETNARGDYYRSIGNAREDATSPWGTPFETDQGFMQYNKHTGEVRAARAGAGTNAGAGSSAAPIDDNAGGRGGDAQAGLNALGDATASDASGSGGPLFKVRKPPKDATLKDANVINPAAGTIEDVYSDGSRKTVRKATSAELAKATHVPRDGNEAPPMNPSTTESYLNAVADRAVQAANGDVKQAAAMASQDPAGLEAYNKGLATRHFTAAKARYDRQKAIDTERYPTMDPANAAPPLAKPASAGSSSGGFLSTIKSALSSGSSKSSGPPPNVPSAKPPTPPPTGDVTLGDQGGTENVDPALAANPAVQHALKILTSGRGTVEQMMATNNLTPEQKQAARRLFMRGTK